MLKLLTFVTILVSVSPAAFADDAPCNFVIDSAGAGSKMGTVTCPYCVLMADYSNFGAANMVDNTDNYTSMVVKNGSNEVLVTAEDHTYATFASIGYGIFSYNIRSTHRMALEITSYTIKGSVRGQSWMDVVTDKRHLRQVCKTASEDTLEYVRKSVADDLAREAGNAARGDSAGLSPMPGLNSPSVPMPDDCSNCYSEPVNWWDWYYFRRF